MTNLGPVAPEMKSGSADLAALDDVYMAQGDGVECAWIKNGIHWESSCRWGLESEW